MVLYWRYREEESHYLQVYCSRVHCVHCVQSSAEAIVLYWRCREEESHYLKVGFNVYIVYRVQQRLWSSTRDIERRTPTTFK